MSEEICATPNCGKPASLSCPKCLNLKITKRSKFCSQQCFKDNYKPHTELHKAAKFEMPDYVFTGDLRPAYVTSKRRVPDHIPRPDYADHPLGASESERAARRNAIRVHNMEDCQAMRETCRLGREVLDIAAEHVKPGVMTDEIDRIVHDACVERDCYPSPLNYYNFPKSVCTSVNEVICHGIPDCRELQEGDICNVDVTVFKNGCHGDLNETYFVGDVDDESKHLVKVAKECLDKAIELAKPGTMYREVGSVIEKHAKQNNCSVVRTYCGHGISDLFHTSPNVPHYHKNKAPGVMKPGHIFTIEPMINLGTWKDRTWGFDDWTAVTQDGKRSAQFEHTLLITENGNEILTARLPESRASV